MGLSRNAVWKRIRTMEQNGVIASRVAILDAAAFDLNLTVFIQLKTASYSKDGIKRLERTCKLLPQVQGAYRMSGLRRFGLPTTGRGARYSGLRSPLSGID